MLTFWQLKSSWSYAQARNIMGPQPWADNWEISCYLSSRSLSARNMVRGARLKTWERISPPWSTFDFDRESCWLSSFSTRKGWHFGKGQSCQWRYHGPAPKAFVEIGVARDVSLSKPCSNVLWIPSTPLRSGNERTGERVLPRHYGLHVCTSKPIKLEDEALNPWGSGNKTRRSSQAVKVFRTIGADNSDYG